MSTNEYICSILTMGELFKVRDALLVLDKYGFGDKFIEQSINAELERRTNDRYVHLSEM